MGTGKPRSISVIRQQMQMEREEELGSRGSEMRQTNGYYPRRPLEPPDDYYSTTREQRMAEERQYRGQTHDNPSGESSGFGRKRWDDEPRHQVRFESDPYPGKARGLRWEDEEKELMQWAKSHGILKSRQVPTPPLYESPRKQVPRDDSHMRSVSAPVVPEGIAGLGVKEDPVVRRNKQREYAEELRAQMREKEKAKQREKFEVQESPPGGTKPNTAIEFTDSSHRYHNDGYHPSDKQRNYRSRPQRSPGYEDHKQQYIPFPQPHGSGFYYPPDYPPPPPPPTWGPSYHWPRPPYPPPLQYPLDPYYPQPYYYPPPPRRHEHELEFKSNRQRNAAEFETEEHPIYSRRGNEEKEFTSPLTGDLSPRRGGTRPDKASYRAELEKQIKERKENKTKERIEKERFELKKEAEIYNPWGKGGCGAPVRDKHGNLVADLKKMRKINEDNLLMGPPTESFSSPPQGDSGGGDVDDSPRRDSFFDYSARNEEVVKEETQNSYRDFLKRQVEEKKELKRQEKEQKRLEEQKELDRLEKERVKMQEDYKREVEKQKRKEAEIRARNEALTYEAEKKRKADAQNKQNEELREGDNERQLSEERLHQALTQRIGQPLPQQRSRSPPVPALKHKMAQMQFTEPPVTEMVDTHMYHSSSPPVPAVQHKLQQQPSQQPDLPRTNSPPVPALLNKTRALVVGEASSRPSTQLPAPHQAAVSLPGHENSSDILKRLSEMRRHLQLEQNKLSKQQVEGATTQDVFDPVRFQKPKMVIPKVRKGGGQAQPSALNEFVAIKSSKNDFLKLYPEVPHSGRALEDQQEALLRHQEENLARLRAGGRLQHHNLLASETEQIPASSSRIKDPFRGGDILRPDPSLLSDKQQPKQRQWQTRSSSNPRLQSPGGQSQFSVITFDVDSIAHQNEERRRRLDAILNASAGESTQNPQTVLHEFLKRTNKTVAGGSRQSERSLDCETGFHPVMSAYN